MARYERHSGAFLCILGLMLLSLNSGRAFAHEYRLISEWVVGDGITDDSRAVAEAFAAAKNGAFTLIVDRPVFIHIGMDITRPIFIDHGTHVDFWPEFRWPNFDGLPNFGGSWPVFGRHEFGKFIVDNVFVPAFVIANSTDVVLQNWNVEYTGSLPIDEHAGGYYNNGFWVPSIKAGSYDEPAFAFNAQTLTEWLAHNRNITFPHDVSSPWTGPTNTSSVFFIIGSTQKMTVSNLYMHAASVQKYVSNPLLANGADKFIPMAFSLTHGYNSDQTAVRPPASGDWTGVPGISVPSQIDFQYVTLDGYYMGFQGELQNSTFDHITGLTYADLMDSSGNNVGGIGKWFAPPHLLYIKYQDSNHPYDPRLGVNNITISNVADYGIRMGTARDVTSTASGYANSLKLGAMNSTVTNYNSLRPDGLLDVLSCRNMTLTHVSGVYSSSFLNDLYAGVRFPAAGFYENLTLNNVVLTDSSANPYSNSGKKVTAFSGNVGTNNSNIVFNEVVVNLKAWNNAWAMQQSYSGTGNQVGITFNVGCRNSSRFELCRIPDFRYPDPGRALAHDF